MEGTPGRAARLLGVVGHRRKPLAARIRVCAFASCRVTILHYAKVAGAESTLEHGRRILRTHDHDVSAT